MDDCIFCKIIRGEAEVSPVYENDRVLAFMDLVPINPGHTLVIPKLHAPELKDLPPELGGEIFQVAMRIEQAIRDSDIPAEATNLLLSNGRIAGQEVLHLHLHVIPRLRSDGSGFRFNSVNRELSERALLNQSAALIKMAFHD